MQKLKIDFYKTIFLIVLAIFTYCYYMNLQVGRFSQINDKYGFPLILDTKSGATYKMSGMGRELELYNPPIIKK